MTRIDTTQLGPGHVGVELHEGGQVTHHEVVIDGNLLDEMVLLDAEPHDVARATVEFLLDRHATAELPSRISIRDVDRTEPEYRSELPLRLRGT